MDNPMGNIKAVVFDADGVLIHAEQWSQILAHDYGIPYSQIEPFFIDQFQRCMIGKADLKVEIAPYLSRWGFGGTVDELLKYWFSSEHKPDELLIKYIQGLRYGGIKCFVATNQEKYRANYMRNKMGFESAFDGFIASFAIGFRKPNQEFFSAVNDKIGQYEKSEILFWDDQVKAVSAAQKFGWHAEMYTNFDHFRQKMERYLEDR